MLIEVDQREQSIPSDRRPASVRKATMMIGGSIIGTETTVRDFQSVAFCWRNDCKSPLGPFPSTCDAAWPRSRPADPMRRLTPKNCSPRPVTELP